MSEVVQHLTEVVARRLAPARAEALARALEAEGFEVSRRGAALVGRSREVEALDAKRRLRARGFSDDEYAVVLEYARGWGML